MLILKGRFCVRLIFTGRWELVRPIVGGWLMWVVFCSILGGWQMWEGNFPIVGGWQMREAVGVSKKQHSWKL